MALSLGSLLLTLAAAYGQAAHHVGDAVRTQDDDAVLTRNIDKRPLPAEALDSLSPAMRRAVEAVLQDVRLGADPNRATRELLAYTLQRIPVAPRDHTLHLLAFTGELGCASNGPNCRAVVFDETVAGVETVVDDGVVAIAVVRRPHLQLPDIARYEQEGHASMDTMVLRFDGTAWKPFRCSNELITATLTPKRTVADKPCTMP